MVIWNRRNLTGLTVNISIAIVIALPANIFVFLVNPNEDMAPPINPFEPPGYLVGIVWVCLFVFMGTARWLVIVDGEKPFQGTLWIWALLLLCAAYPIYTLGLNNLAIGLAGNIATGSLALWIAGYIRKVSLLAAGLVSTVAIWVAFASFLIIEQITKTS